MIKRLFLVLIILGVVLGGVFAFKLFQLRMMQAQFAQPLPPTPIAAALAQQEQWQPRLQAVGSLVAVNGTEVTTEIGGSIKTIQFESGQPVKAGAVLLQLEDSVDKAALDGARAERRLAEVKLNRAMDLIKRSAISKSEFDETQANADAAQARLAEKAAKLAQKTIRAPFDGLLGIRMVNLGQYLAPGSRIVSLQALDPIYVDYALPERYLPELSVGQGVEVKVAAYPDRVFGGNVSALASAIDTGNRSIVMRATLSNSDMLLRPGMFAEVATLQPQALSVITVPQTAVSFNTYGNFVYVITPGDGNSLLAKRRQVTTGRSRAGNIEIVQGLQAGEQVVRAGLVKLRDGQSVVIDNAVNLDDAKVSKQ